MLRLRHDEDGRLMSVYCAGCRDWVTPRVIDQSFGYSYGSISGVHQQESIECPRCEGAELSNEEPETETEE